MRTLLTSLALLLLSSFVLACASEPSVIENTAQSDSRPTSKPTKAFDQDHAQWTAILKKHVHEDRFDYASVKKDQTALNEYLASLHAVTKAELESWNPKQRMAFWINTYNAHVVKLVSDNYPVDSIRDLGTLLNKVWNKRFIEMKALHPSGKDKNLSLDDVEHKILRPRFLDARVHAAVNCASDSCPPLRGEAFTAKKLDEQLDEQVRAWLADESRNRFNLAAGKLEISEIFKWFKEDFVRDGKSVTGWIAKYAPEAVATAIQSGAKLKVSYLDYSWKLNTVSGTNPSPSERTR